MHASEGVRHRTRPTRPNGDRSNAPPHEEEECRRLQPQAKRHLPAVSAAVGAAGEVSVVHSCGHARVRPPSSRDHATSRLSCPVRWNSRTCCVSASAAASSSRSAGSKPRLCQNGPDQRRKGIRGMPGSWPSARRISSARPAQRHPPVCPALASTSALPRPPGTQPATSPPRTRRRPVASTRHHGAGERVPVTASGRRGRSPRRAAARAPRCCRSARSRRRPRIPRPTA